VPPGTGRPDASRERFLEYNRSTRDTASARELLAAEWRYLGPLLGDPAGLRVLDLACGSAPHALAWAERGAQVVGVDFDRDLLVVGRERCERDAMAPLAITPRFACGDATRLPLASARFDVVFCNSLLEHVPAWESVVAEIARVLVPGGLAIVYTTNRACPLQQEVNSFPFYSWLPDPIQRRTLAWIMKHRPDLVNYTRFPAVNWFTFGQMRHAFERHGLRPLDRVDIAARGASGARGALLSVMTRWPLLKWPYYVRTIAMALYGVREGAWAGEATTRNTVKSYSGSS
jgi:ubiquinone/menaquinone biosynthesis C-methylase UbiE